MSRRCRALSALFIGLLAAAEAFATSLDVKATGAKTFYVDGRAGNNQISVFSESTLEDFTSICNKVRGKYKLDPQNLEAFTDRFYFRWKDLDTGIPLRNEQMLSQDWMDADRYPEVLIEIGKVEDVKKVSEKEAEMVMVGTCTMHGVTRPVRIPVKLAYLDQSPETMKRIRRGPDAPVAVEFEVKLADYGIVGPKGSNMIGLKVSDVQKVKFTVLGSTSKPPEELKADTRGLATQPAGGGDRPGPGGVVRPPPPRPRGN